MKPTDTKTSTRRTIKDQSGAGKLKIGELLSKAGYINSQQFEQAKNLNRRTGMPISRILLDSGAIDEDTIPNFLSRMHGFMPINLTTDKPTQDALDKLSFEQAKGYMALPIRVIENGLLITMAEPTDTNAIEELQDLLKVDLKVGVSSYKSIADAYKEYYKIDEEEYQRLFEQESSNDKAVDEGPSELEDTDLGELMAAASEEYAVELDSGGDGGANVVEQFSANDAPIIKLVNQILVQAVQNGVSDIHIEPFEKTMQVRYRKDGALYKSMNLPLNIRNALAARVKILSGLNITERRVPQDGRIQIKLNKNKAVDFRVSTLPLLHGEGIVLRILDKGSLNVDLTMLGFTPDTFASLKRCLNRPQGLLLVTGPTGSGKTVTLYSALNSLNREDTKILTAEDPVEFNFKGINQVNVNNEVGMTFAAALKAFLRQDPDIIMVGEIRDMETAEIAIKAAMTGHLVFATLHTNDAPATVSRMVDIGIPPFMLASSLTMVLAQRLGRRLCKHCKQEAKTRARVEAEILERPDVKALPTDRQKKKVEELLLSIKLDYTDKELLDAGFKEEELKDLKLYKAKGCPECNGRGYKGRVGFFELMEVTKDVAAAIQAEVSEEQLRKVAGQSGMYTLREAALQKARDGITSLDEVLKRTVVHESTLPPYLVNPDVEVYQNGEEIIKEDNRDNDFFRLEKGQLEVLRDKKKIGMITEPKEYFGEMAAMLNIPRTATVRSVGRSTVKRFPGDKLYEIIEKYPDISKKLFRVLGDRIFKTDKLLGHMADAMTKMQQAKPTASSPAASPGQAGIASRPTMPGPGRMSVNPAASSPATSSGQASVVSRPTTPKPVLDMPASLSQ